MTRKSLFWTSERSKERSKEPTAKFLTVLNDKQYNSSHSNSTDQINILTGLFKNILRSEIPSTKWNFMKFHWNSIMRFWNWNILNRNIDIFTIMFSTKILPFYFRFFFLFESLLFSLFRSNSTLCARIQARSCTTDALLCTLFIIFNIRNWKIKFFVLLRDVCLDLF